MESLPTITLLVLGAFLLGFTGLLLSLYGFLSKWFKFLSDEKNSVPENIKQRAYREAAKVLDDAREKSSLIVSEAHSRAEAMLSETEDLTGASKDKLLEVLKEVEQKYDSMMKESAGNLVGMGEKALAKSTAVLEKEAHDEISELRGRLEEEAKAEIEKYKNDRLAELNEKLVTIVSKAAIEVLGKKMSIEDQEQLVIEALEKAKSEHIL